ncbi:MAG: FkbM family methyltransferase, partial [Cyclobacteriaceae bacterium]|nr:FkbM family methyltransferase [Cyclobacteriaceae bacterium]
SDPQAFYVGPHSTTGEKVIDKIESTTMNRIVKENSISQIDILKIDIEGAEKALFSENLEWLKIVNCLIFEVPDVDAPYTTQLVYRALSVLGFDFRTFVCSECIVLIKSTVDWELRTINGYLQRKVRR